MNKLMCEDLALAKLNRERVAQGETNRFYDQQAACCAQWTGGKPPDGLVLGNLPHVGLKQLRVAIGNIREE